MKVGIQFPSSTIGNDPEAIRGFAVETEKAGFHHISYGEHIVWAVKGDGDARASHTYHDVLTTMAFHAAVTSTIELFPALLVMPQRQALLVAKQCAQIDLLSGGRIRVGVGVGSLAAEYAAMGADIHIRGRMIEDQIGVMRALWSNDWAEYHGRYHDMDGATLGITHPQRPLPVWIGGGSETALARAGRIGDGWLATARTNDVQATVGKIRDAAKQAGRDPKSVGIQGRIFLKDKSADQWKAEVDLWRGVDAGYVDVRDDGLEPLAHIAKAVEFVQATGVDKE